MKLILSYSITIRYPESSISINVQPASGSYDNPGFNIEDESFEQNKGNVNGTPEDEQNIRVILYVPEKK